MLSAIRDTDYLQLPNEEQPTSITVFDIFVVAYASENAFYAAFNPSENAPFASVLSEGDALNAFLPDASEYTEIVPFTSV
ncbi:unnamed protein product [Didymodactylos carnosus]|uniref:Uncharacterized protein n=1 Tax=Didymodactylos carnosus TaxID=1234261 RepID=A0A815X0R7_9BILA|nr:unnamed protein product [Didymodactylos carnosus]CAF4412585.1 unnamed protein product [Didymodactylos carnosus]